MTSIFFYFLFLEPLGRSLHMSFQVREGLATFSREQGLTNQGTAQPLLHSHKDGHVGSLDLGGSLRPAPPALDSPAPTDPFSLCGPCWTLTQPKGKQRQCQPGLGQGWRPSWCTLVEKKELTISFGLNTFKHRSIKNRYYFL